MKEQKIDEKGYELVQVPASYANAIQTPEGEVLSAEQAIVEILNILKNLDNRI